MTPPTQSDIRRRGRLYLHPTPASGPHPGFRGPLIITAFGVEITWDCEALYEDEDRDPLAAAEWEPALLEELIPWHRVNSIEWTDSPPEDANA